MGEFVGAEEVAVVKRGQVVDVNLSGLERNKDCYNSRTSSLSRCLDSKRERSSPCPPGPSLRSQCCPAALRNGCADTRPALKPAALR